jgi:Fe-S-cluster containining protein
MEIKPVEEQRLPLGHGKDEHFTFSCHPGVSCFLHCCHKVTLYLFPYDIIRLKKALKLHSGEFLQRYVRVVEGSHPYFPSLVLTLAQQDDYPCPFLGREGCTVYRDRPSACRTYPLERGVEKTGAGAKLISHYSLVKHPYCKGHEEQRQYTVSEWERDQDLGEFNAMNELWAEMDAFFSTNPWMGEEKAGPRQQLAFMVSYNIDAFREYVSAHDLIRQFRLDRKQRRRIARDDSALLEFGFLWLRHALGKKTSLQPV